MEAASEKMADDVFRDLLQPIIARDDVVLLAELPLELLLGVIVQLGLLDQSVDILVQVRIL